MFSQRIRRKVVIGSYRRRNQPIAARMTENRFGFSV